MGNAPAWHLTKFWRWNIGLWTALAVPMFLVRFAMHQNALRAFGLTLFQETLSILLCGLLHWAYSWWMKHRHDFNVSAATILIALSLAATGMQSMAVLYLVHLTGWDNPLWSPLEEWLMRLLFYWLIYMAFSLLYFWLQAERHAHEKSKLAAESKAAAQRMELQLLRAQLDPHFLFNSLNGVATIIPTNPDAAVSMVLDLSDYLRYSLENRNSSIIPLAAEIDAMNAYLKIEKARFGDQMFMRVTADEDARSRTIPCFLLQPLVENAVKHGFQTADPPWKVMLHAETLGDSVVVTVINKGRLSPDPYGTGLGLQILRRRLHIHYPKRHRLNLHQDGDTVCAELQLEGEPCSA
jgi:two-component system LytT family sensor kinase